MKKLLVLLLALTFVSAFVSAQDAAPVPEAKLVAEISGNATMTFGINLDNSATGIANAIDSNIKLQLVTKATTEKGGKEGETVYGWIKLKDFEVKTEKSVLTGNAPGIEAKLFLGPVYINILGDGAGTDKTLVNGAVVNNADGDGIWDALGMTVTTTASGVNWGTKEPKQDGADQNGILIGLTDTSIVDVKLGINSLYDWAGTDTVVDTSTTNDSTLENFTTGGTVPAGTEYQNLDTNTVYTPGMAFPAGHYAVYTYTTTTVTTPGDPANTDNVYGFWAAAALKAVPGLTFEVKAGLNTLLFSSDSAKAKANPFGLGVKAGYDITIADGYVLTPVVGFDMKFADTMAWRLSGGVNFVFPGAKLDDWEKFNVIKKDSKLDIKPGAAVVFAYDSLSKADMEIQFFDGDLIPVVNLVAVGQLYDLTGTMKVGIGAFATADFGMVAPWLGLQSKLAPTAIKTTFLQVGFDLKVITNTTFTLQYDSGDLAKDPAGKGIIKFSTKIAY